MSIRDKAKEYFFRYSYIETTIVIVSFLGIGYAIDPEDIFMLNMDFSFLAIILAVITLFHGISSGFLAMLILAIVMHYAYAEFQYFYYLKEFILVMIYGEFHYYWNRIINQQNTENKFTREKLSQLSKAFYMLKISHDQIEKSYVVKPMSLRNSILEIKENHERDKSSNYYQEFLQLLQKTLNIEYAFLLTVEEYENMSVLVQTDSSETIDTKDLLIKDSYRKQMSLYVSTDGAYSGSKYLASIPAMIKGEIIGMLVISEMPFMSFNKDNLISATILVNYMFNEMKKMEIMKTIDNFLPLFQSNFRFESYRLHHLNKNFATETTMLLFKSHNKLSTHLLIEVIKKNLRTLDIMSTIKSENFEIIAILFPFADASSVDGFVERIYDKADIKDDTKHVRHTSISIGDIALIEEFIEGVK